MNHEFQTHRVKEQWSCNLCEETFDCQPLLHDHFELRHEHQLVAFQVEDVVSTSRRVVIRGAAKEQCPFCLTCPSQTQKGYASHVGRHLQEISLAALPVIEAASDDENENDDDDDDDDDNDDGSDRGPHPTGSEVDDLAGTDDDDDQTVKDHDSDHDSTPASIGSAEPTQTSGHNEMVHSWPNEVRSRTPERRALAQANATAKAIDVKEVSNLSYYNRMIQASALDNMSDYIGRYLLMIHH
jgi:cobalamin biosynthesis protein CobT